MCNALYHIPTSLVRSISLLGHSQARNLDFALPSGGLRDGTNAAYKLAREINSRICICCIGVCRSGIVIFHDNALQLRFVRVIVVVVVVLIKVMVVVVPVSVI